MKKFSFLVFIILAIFSCEQKIQEISSSYDLFKPWQIYPELFKEVQLSGIFEDSKTFVDCVPLKKPEIIREQFQSQKNEANFDLEKFVKENFELPTQPNNDSFESKKEFEEHLNNHWSYLTRETTEIDSFTTLIQLPNPYIVPGGRFREIYYWDSYFSMIGLGVSGKVELVESMLDNFAYLMDTVGYIPNGNRTYFMGRSQPPFFASMINLYAQLESREASLKYLSALEKEYNFWMKGSEIVGDSLQVFERVVYYKGYVLNRYFDNAGGPREESYREDLELAKEVENLEQLFLDLRAACESGWDFSSRWFDESGKFSSIRTTKILPIDLNSLLYNTELELAKLYRQMDKPETSHKYLKKAESRYQAINEVFWNEKQGMFQDVLWQDSIFTGVISAASYYPMYFKAANFNNAEIQTISLARHLVTDGGVLTTVNTSGQQWDAPNGWAPLQWIAYKGLQHYGKNEMAEQVKESWLAVNQKVFANTGKMMEKYNVSDTTLIAGGGEYPNQDGFGWTNGVALGMLKAETAY